MSKGNNQNIQVFVRVRPSNSLEQKSRSVVEIPSETDISVKEHKQNDTYKTFSFNKVFGPKSHQIDVYMSVVGPLISEVVSGYNCTVFAYGQTGTGKTFTMEGEHSPDGCLSWADDPLAGIIPRSLSQLFDELRMMKLDFAMRVSFLELYNEDIFDLLSPSDDTTKLKMFDDGSKKGSVVISGLEEVTVHSKADVYNILEKGSLKRQTAATLMNAHSSRSHTVFTVTIHIREQTPEGQELLRTGKLNLVDLAGSENIGRSGAVLKHAREAGNINQSLLTLGRVITALVDNAPHVPYRQSKLTRLLQESLGGRTKTSIIATISPAMSNLEETLSTLDYAHRAKNIMNKPEINQKFCKKTLLKEYSEEIERLQCDLEATRQRTGIYMDQDEYLGKLARIEQMTSEIKERKEHISALYDEYEKKQAICDEIGKEVNEADNALKTLTTVKDKTEETLKNVQTTTAQISTETFENEHLLMHHVDTYQRLVSQTEVLHEAAEAEIQSFSKLCDKLEVTREVSQKNRDAFQKFYDSYSFKLSCIGEEVSNAVSHSHQQSCTLQSDMCNGALRSLGNLACIDETNARLVHVPEDVATLKCLEQESFNSEYDWFDKFLSVIKESKHSASDEFSKLLNMVDDHGDIMKCSVQENIKQLSQELQKIELKKKDFAEQNSSWGLGQDECKNISDKFFEINASQCASLQQLAHNHETFRMNFNQTEQEIHNKLEAIRQTVNEVNHLHQKWEEQIKSHDQSSLIYLSKVKSDVKNSYLTISSSLANIKERVCGLEIKHNQDLGHLAADIVSAAEKSKDVPCLTAMEESFCESTQVLEDTWSQLLSKTEHLFAEDEHLRTRNLSSFSSKAQILESQITEAVKISEVGVAAFEAGINDVVCDVKRVVKDFHADSNSFDKKVSEELTSCSTLIEDFVSCGVQAPVSSGQTPQRSSLNIPREIPATSPHERILKRIRQKYHELMFSPKKLDSQHLGQSSPDSAFSGDTDSDASVSSDPEQSILVDKENVHLVAQDQDLNGKKSNQLSSKPRKPLQQNN